MMTNFLRNAILAFLFGGVDVSPTPTLYFALFSSMPTVAGGGTEVAGGSYARVAVTNNQTNFPAPVAGSNSDAVAITFAQATALWGTVVGVGVFDALSGGNLLHFAPLTASRTVNAGDTFSFSVGQLVATAS